MSVFEYARRDAALERKQQQLRASRSSKHILVIPPKPKAKKAA